LRVKKGSGDPHPAFFLYLLHKIKIYRGRDTRTPPLYRDGCTLKGWGAKNASPTCLFRAKKGRCSPQPVFLEQKKVGAAPPAKFLDWGGKEGGASKEGGKGEPYRGPPTGGGGPRGVEKGPPKGHVQKDPQRGKRTPKGAKGPPKGQKDPQRGMCKRGGGLHGAYPHTHPLYRDGCGGKGQGGGGLSGYEPLSIHRRMPSTKSVASHLHQPASSPPPYSVHGQPGFYTALAPLPLPPPPIPAFFLYLLHKIKIYRDGGKGSF